MSENGTSMVNSLIESVSSAVMTVGRAGLHVLGPDNFEYYMCAFKLVDSAGKTTAMLTFPVMPNNIIETQPALASVMKTNTGVVTQFNHTFNPIDISLQGTFGRKIRLILGQKEYVGEAAGAWQMAQKFFNVIIGINMGIGGTDILIKTGYGLTKMLMKMLKGAYELDKYGSPQVLYFSNYSLNTSYIVEPLQRSFSQSVDNNMMWYYSLELKAVADATDNSTQWAAQFMTQVAVGLISSTLTNVIGDAMRMIPL